MRFFVSPRYKVRPRSTSCGAMESIAFKMTPSSWSLTMRRQTNSFFSVPMPRSSCSITVRRPGRFWLVSAHEFRARSAMRFIAASPATAIVSLAVTMLVPCPTRKRVRDFLTWNPERVPKIRSSSESASFSNNQSSTVRPAHHGRSDCYSLVTTIAPAPNRKIALGAHCCGAPR